MSEYVVEYDKEDEDFPKLKGKDFSVELFRGYYFKSLVDVGEQKGTGDMEYFESELHRWENYSDLPAYQISNYIFSELIPAFASNMHDLHSLVTNNIAILEEFINASLCYFGKREKFRVGELQLTNISELHYANQIYIRAYCKYDELNPVALKYLVSKDLPGTYRYLQDYKAEIDAGINVINEINHTLFGLEQVLFTMDKDFESKIRLCDASGLRYLILRYVDSLNDKVIGKYKTANMNAF